MRIVACLVSLVAVVNAAFFNNQSSLSGDIRHSFNSSKPNQISLNGNIQHASNSSRLNQTSLKSNNRNSSSLYDSKDFVDCTKYSAAELANATIPMPFEEYWCIHVYHTPSEQAAVAKDYQGSFARNLGQLYGLDTPTKSFCLSLEKENYTSFYATGLTERQWWPVYTSPCCDTTSCAVHVANAQMLYWPTPAPVPGVSTIIGSDGFIYTSPSVYVVYTNISATNDCSSTIGNTYGTTILSYAPSDLHSMEYNFALSGTTSVSVIGEKWNTINYADLISNCTGLPFNNPSWSDGNEMWQNWMYTLKHCYPLLQDSPALGLVDPAWAKCDQQIAMYDPPRALIPGKALGPVPPAPTRNTGAPVAAVVAAPASQAANPTPTPTPAPVSSPKSDSSSGNSNDPASAKDSAANDFAPADPKAANDLTPAKESSNSDSNTDKDPSVANPVNDPASAKDPSNNNSPTNNDPAAVAQNPANDPADGSGPKSIDSPPAGPAPAPVLSVTTIAGHSIQILASQPSVGVVLVDGQSITAGAYPKTVSSTYIALHTNGDLILGTSTVHNIFPTNPPALELIPPVTSIDGHGVQIAPSQPSVVLVDGQPITAGAYPTTVSSTHIALHTNGDLILGTSTIHNILPTAPPAPLSYFTVGSQIITLSSSHILAAGTTYAPRDAGFAVDNTLVSLGSSALHIATSTIPISPSDSPLPAIVTTAAGHLLTLLPSGVIVAGTTLTANAPAITVSSTLLSFGAAGFVAGTSTFPLVLPTNPPLALSSVFTTLGQTFTALPSGAIAVAGVTLTSNAPGITVSGTLMSLGASGFVNGTTTISLPSVETASPTGGLGGFIYSGINGGSNGTQNNGTGPGSNPEVFFGGTDRIALRSSFLIGVAMLIWLYRIG